MKTNRLWLFAGLIAMISCQSSDYGELQPEEALYETQFSRIADRRKIYRIKPCRPRRYRLKQRSKYSLADRQISEFKKEEVYRR